MSDGTPMTDKKFASRVDWNLMRTFVDIVRAGGIGAAAQSPAAQHQRGAEAA
jgi:LysR family transcriptional regulator, transcriptional activator for bauABCD operon